MPDLKDELRQLADEAASQARPLPVADVIREGDRWHRRTIIPRRRQIARPPGPTARARPGRRWPGWVAPLAAAAAVVAVVAVTVTVSGALRGPGPTGRSAASTVYAVYSSARVKGGNRWPGAIIPIHTATNTLGKPTRIRNPFSAAITPDGKTIYADIAYGPIVPISTANGKPGKPIRIPPGLYHVAMNPDGKTVYASNYSNVIIPISTATNKPGKPIRITAEVDNISFAPGGKTAYALAGIHSCSVPGMPTASPGPSRHCKKPSTITPINTATNKPGKPIPVSTGADRIVFAPDGAIAYVGSYKSVTPINLASNTPGTPIGIHGGADSMRITPDGKTVYVGTDNDTVVPINTATNTAGKPIRLGGYFPWEMAIAPDGKTVYIADLPRAVVPISTATNTAGKPIRIGLGLKIAIAPAGKTLYAATDSKIIPIDIVTNTPGKPIRLPIRLGDPAAIVIP